LETGSGKLIEKASHFIRSRRKYIRSSIRKLLKRKIVNQRNSENSVGRCEDLTFDHDSTVDEPLVAAEHKDINKNNIGKQSQGVESIDFSIHGTRCQNPEIVRFDRSEEVSSFPIIQFGPAIRLMKEEAVWKKASNLLKKFQINSDEELHHFNLDDPHITKHILGDGN
jgi:hypothetical protein